MLMPIYEYECSSCHFIFERRQNFNDKPVAVCPRCRGKARRIIHPVSTIFKGKGFYVTDSRKGAPKPTKPVEKEKKSPKEEKPK
jgi:putative FmdB family regulatory protein